MLNRSVKDINLALKFDYSTTELINFYEVKFDLTKSSLLHYQDATSHHFPSH